MYSKIKPIPAPLTLCSDGTFPGQPSNSEEVKRKDTFTNKTKNKDEPSLLYKTSGQEHKLLC